ncbi:glycosyltransferase [Vibrio cyclitrophicus]
MKVLHLCMSDTVGGAARAALRIHNSQINAGIDSHLLVIEKNSAGYNVVNVSNRIRIRIRIINLLKKYILKSFNLNDNVSRSLNFFPSGIVNLIKDIGPDLINIHWIGGEIISIRELSNIKKPIIWTMHDMWAFCATEHYELESNFEAYTDGLKKYKNIDSFIYNYKNKYIKKMSLITVSPSHWLRSCADKSEILSNVGNYVIQNPINHDVYFPINKDLARKSIGLEGNKKYILFGAMSSLSDPRKGNEFLLSALEIIFNENDTENLELLVFGASSGNLKETTGITTHYFGTLQDDISLRLLYNSADIFVAPSLQDNLPNTIVESLACGTPCVAFNIGGMSDLINKPYLGVLVDKVEGRSLANSIMKSLSTDFDCKIIHNHSKSIRDEIIIGNEYYDLYTRTIERKLVGC